jgi:hypothetical protein
MFAGAASAMAGGPHHGHGYGRGPNGNWNNYGRHYQAYRYPPQRICRPPICGPVAPYPVYPAPVVTAYPAYPRLGFGLGGANFSFFYQQ